MGRKNGSLGTLLVFACTAIVSFCCSGICVDVIPNFTLTEVSYDQDGALLYVSGNMSLSYCEGPWEEVDKYASSRLILDLNSLGYDVKIDKTKDRKTIKAPVELPRIFRGSFPSGCNLCDLTVSTKDNTYTLFFTTDPDTIWERIQGHDIPGSAMLLVIYKGEDVLAEFAFGYLSVEKVPAA